ncbi:tripartite tricarboxylate transporter substrate binding protein [Paralcaligenes sp. KSB-10]|jgi:tripartite-type tricarboxylate transporter receptor subunit TctC|uniref:Bug family tripartite tricarboxylate transporter substrate binding protein n=1 Tax=Paralcaligenes sp. KSB-10 TaxID=2901142 RepID=UPI001E602DAD|nr:tripartite tricarboxylate transporter substrate binding protein [Paralcaligenes sp. KSB-10]UHL64807.1 tripartite tricarboxylate transporter substrate binding protein [Paralcaligenes sp. KSB-10]
MHKHIKVGIAACLFSFSTISAAAYPDRAIEFIVPYAPGGTTDLIARIVATKLGDVLGQSVVVANKPGAGGAVGSAYAARQKPDGYTLVMAVESSHAVNPSVRSKPPYDPINDFTPISNLANVLGVLDVSAKSNIKTFQQLLDVLKAKPGKLAFGSSGLGGYSHLFGERFLSVTKTNMLHVPYNGLGPALAGLLGGQVDVVFDNLPSSAGQIAAGTFRALAVAAPSRVKSMPDVPTYAEVGYPQLNTPSWFGMAAPAKLPADVLETLNKAVGKVLADPKVIDLIEKQGAVPDHTSPEEFKKIIEESNKRWQGVVQAIGFEKL